MTKKEDYKKAQDTVLKRYATDSGSKGQSQFWKVSQIERIMATPDEKLTDCDIRMFAEFLNEVEEELNRIEMAIPNVIRPPTEKVAAVEKKPAEPEPRLPDPSAHGIDLDWN